MGESSFVRVAFELQQDADGYPPDKWEILWAERSTEVSHIESTTSL